jgi:hypothetical protein
MITAQSIFLKGTQYLPQSIKSLDGVRATAAALQVLSPLVPFQAVRSILGNVTNGFLLGTHTWVIQRAFISLLKEDKTFSFEGELSTRMILIRKTAQLFIMGSALSMFAGISLTPRSKARDFAELLGVGIGTAILFKDKRKKEEENSNGRQVSGYRETIRKIEEQLTALNGIEETVATYRNLNDIPKKIVLGDTTYDLTIAIEETENADALERAKMLFRLNLNLLKGKLETDLDRWQDVLLTKESKESHYRQVAFTAAFFVVGILPLLTRNLLQSTVFSKIQAVATTAWGASSLLLAISEGYSVEITEAEATLRNLKHLDNELSVIAQKHGVAAEPIGVEFVPEEVESKSKKNLLKGFWQSVKRTKLEKPDKMKERRGSTSTVSSQEKSITFTSTVGSLRKELTKVAKKVELAIQQFISEELIAKEKGNKNKRQTVFSVVLPTGQEIQYNFEVSSEEEEREVIRKSLLRLKSSLNRQNPTAGQTLLFHQVKIYQSVAFAFAAVLPLITKNLPKPFASLSTIASVASVGLAFAGLASKSPQKTTSPASFFPTN